MLAALRQSEFCYVLNTRQIGKSSLMVRTAQALRAEGVRVAVLDLTAIGQNVSVEAWYDGLLTLIAEQLHLEDELEAFWLRHERLSPMQKWMMALRQIVLQDAHPICIFVDEIDAVRSLPFSTDEFFAGIRECYNRRAQDVAYTRLTFCLLGVAAPTDLIRDPRTTPFNIGTRIELTDFTPEEAAPLAQGLGERRKETGESSEAQTFSFLLFPFSPASTLNCILYWTDGHPYLTQMLCRALAEQTGEQTAQAEPLTRRDVDSACEALFLSKRAQLADDNLAFARSRLLHGDVDRTALLDLYRQLLRGRKFRDDATNPLHDVLRLSGIVKVVEGDLRVRNRIYAQVFDVAWVEQHLPDAELRRQKQAFKRGLSLAGAISGLVLSVVASLAVWAVHNARVARDETDRANRNALIATRKTEDANKSAENARRSEAVKSDALIRAKAAAKG